MQKRNLKKTESVKMQENTRQTLITFNVPAHSVLVARGGLNAILEMVIDRCSHQPHACCRVDCIADCRTPQTAYIWADMQQQVREKKGSASERSSRQGEQQEKQHATLAVGTQRQAATAAAGSKTCTDLDHPIVATLVPPTHSIDSLACMPAAHSGRQTRQGQKARELPPTIHKSNHTSQTLMATGVKVGAQHVVTVLVAQHQETLRTHTMVKTVTWRRGGQSTSTAPNQGSECDSSQDDRIDPRGQSGQVVDSAGCG